MQLTLGISSCPNDTFIFAPMVQQMVGGGEFTFRMLLDDVELLNRLALESALDMVKVSWGVVPKVLEEYGVLPAGGALGFGCGPLLVSAAFSSVDALHGKKIAIPGENTTAFRIFRTIFPDLTDQYIPLRFDRIMPAIAAGEVDAGLVIHEGRFVYQSMGMQKLCDLGEEWERRYHAPIPLGAILLRRSLKHHAPALTELIRSSIRYSADNTDSIMPFITRYAQELSPEVIRSHIGLYVNEYSIDPTPAYESLKQFVGADSFFI